MERDGFAFELGLGEQKVGVACLAGFGVNGHKTLIGKASGACPGGYGPGVVLGVGGP